jgi:hypothetical protein
MYLKPAEKKDLKIIFNTFAKKYSIFSQNDLVEPILELAGGHVQYLHLSLIVLNERMKKEQIVKEDLEGILHEDERIQTQSEEIWDGLTSNEKKAIEHIVKKGTKDISVENNVPYLQDVGLCQLLDKKLLLFSPYFEQYVKNLFKKHPQKDRNHDLSKKENELFVLLLDNLDQIVDRERIISTVWPESYEFGVSDWTIDRLIARVRAKLLLQESAYKITTIKTRGFKMIEDL